MNWLSGALVETLKPMMPTDPELSMLMSWPLLNIVNIRIYHAIGEGTLAYRANVYRVLYLSFKDFETFP
jgi:hypothetical protein